MLITFSTNLAADGEWVSLNNLTHYPLMAVLDFNHLPS